MAPRRRTFPFEGTKVSVVASILRKWAEISTDEKLRFIDASYEEINKRLTTESETQAEEAWCRECALVQSLHKIALLSLFGSLASEKDPKKLQNAASMLERAARELRRRADSTERLPSLSRGNDLTELRRILVQHWVPPDGVCLCWMSYPALAEFLHLTCPNLPVPAAAALKKECQRLGLPKMVHPLVEEEQVLKSGKSVSLLSSRYRR